MEEEIRKYFSGGATIYTKIVQTDRKGAFLSVISCTRKKKDFLEEEVRNFVYVSAERARQLWADYLESYETCIFKDKALRFWQKNIEVADKDDYKGKGGRIFCLKAEEKGMAISSRIIKREPVF